MSISPISSTGPTQSQSQVLMAQLQAQISQQIADKRSSAAGNTTSTTSSAQQDTAQFSPQALQAANSSKTNPLDALVSNGTITQDQETAIDSTLQAAMQAQSGTQSQSSTASTATTGSATTSGPLGSLVTSGVISQSQANAVTNTLKASHHGHHGHHGGSSSAPSTTDTDSSSSAQSSTASTNPLDSLVSNGSITQDQENTINSALAAAMQAYGSLSTTKQP
ncbi:conserved hypothetical protein [Candidatus Desulfosporosinus infrequens]|uniref:Uncharacterized protein n=1 Tax=Candidatus Desulfosporosinus infrequens TaxID=2043169 RepID=A0A2U3KNC7_9FIRM|nr:conserved hypothetical protein [Candidatus Desulfosporosinus infrequens]